MPTVKVGDIDMYYEIHGEGEPLAFVNGMGVNSLIVSSHVPVFSRECQVITFDNRGTGRSDAPAIPYTMDMMADDLAGLLDALGVNSAYLCGTSMGGFIAQTFALRYPKRVKGLILVCTSCGGSHHIPTSDAEYLAFAGNPARLNTMTPKEQYRELIAFTMSGEFIAVNKTMIDDLNEGMLEFPTPSEGMMGQSTVLTSRDNHDHLPEIKAPTMVIHGEADRIVPVENAKVLALQIPGAELVILEGMGHSVWIQAFDEFNRIVLDFLRRHGGR